MVFIDRCACAYCMNETWIARKSRLGDWFLLCKSCFELVEKAAE